LRLNSAVLLIKVLGYAWCFIALLITWVSDWVMINGGTQVVGIQVFNVKDSYALAWLLFPGAFIVIVTYVLEKKYGLGTSKAKALKQYVNSLGGLLSKRYGKSRTYTDKQIERTIKECKLNSAYIIYAYALFMDGVSFEALSHENHINVTYKELRDELGEMYFSKDVSFDGYSVMESGGTNDGPDGGGNGGGDGQGDGGGDG
jgi:hypothetical protein